MGLADEINSNLDALYQETVAANAEDSFAVTIAATVRSVIDGVPPTLSIRSQKGEQARPAAVASQAVPSVTIDESVAPAAGDPNAPVLSTTAPDVAEPTASGDVEAA
jgi:hypothetical protein